MENTNSVTYEKVKVAADFVLSKIPQKPLIGIICGSGLGELYQILENTVDISYEDIPEFPQCTVHGHKSTLTFGTCSGIPIACFRGRFHLYEGHGIDYVVFPVRLMKLLGVETIILTNAAGGINEGYTKGDIMLFKDHVNMVGLSGINPVKTTDNQWGPAFFTVTYNKELLEKARDIFSKCGYTGKIHEGVYACVVGPNFETIAETKFLKLLGADAVGMSTVHEVLAAIHCGLQVLAFSLIVNTCPNSYDAEQEITYEEIVQTGEQYSKLLVPFVEQFVTSIAQESKTSEEKSKKKSCECKDNPARQK